MFKHYMINLRILFKRINQSDIVYSTYRSTHTYIHIHGMGDAKKREVGRYNVAVAILSGVRWTRAIVREKFLFFSSWCIYLIYIYITTGNGGSVNATRDAVFFFTRLFLLFIFIFIFQSARNWLSRLKNLPVLLFIHSAYTYVRVCVCVYTYTTDR